MSLSSLFTDVHQHKMGCCCSREQSNTSVLPIQIKFIDDSPEILSIPSESIPSQESKYKLNIHYRASVLNNGYTKVEKSITGHFFISLEKNGERKYFGKYPKGGGPIKSFFGREKIESQKEADSVLCLQQFEIRNNQKYLDTKTINLSDEQYNKALEYAKSKSEGKIAEKLYVAGLADCTDFVQSIYNAAGLPLYFSSVYRQKELILSLAGTKVLAAYGCLDKFISKFQKIYTSNKKKLAEKLNISEEQIIRLPGNGIYFVDIDDALQKIMNQQNIHELKINRIFIYNLRVENMFNLVKVRLQEQYDTKLSEIKELLGNRIAHYKWDANVKYKAKVKKKKQLLKIRLDNDLKTVNAILTQYEEEMKEAITKENYTAMKKMKKKIKKLKANIRKKNDRYHGLEEYFEKKLKSQLETKMFDSSKKEFQNIYKQINKYKTYVAKHIKGLIDIDDDNKISLSTYRVKLEQIARKLLENTSEKVEEMIIQNFEVFFNDILSNILTSDGKKEHKISLKYFLTNKGIKILVKKFENFKK